MPPEDALPWLPLVQSVGTVLAILVAWGFASGKFIQKRTDEVGDLRKELVDVKSTVDALRRSVSDEQRERLSLSDRTNATCWELGKQFALLKQNVDDRYLGVDNRINRDEKVSDDQYMRAEERMDRMDKSISDLQRQIDTHRM